MSWPGWRRWTQEGIELSVWRIHRKIGMSGGLFTDQLLRETGLAITPELIEIAPPPCRGLPAQCARGEAAPRRDGAARHLDRSGNPLGDRHQRAHGNGRAQHRRLGHRPGEDPGGDARSGQYAKPDPDLFLAAAERLGAPIENAVVVGDSIWDMLASRRCRALGVGLLSGGYGQDELERSGAVRVYEDPRDLLKHLDEVGGRR